MGLGKGLIICIGITPIQFSDHKIESIHLQHILVVMSSFEGLCPGKGRLVSIVIGGAEEVMDAHPGQHNLNSMGRRGFCRFALKTGTPLVPSYSFGENDLFYQYPNPRGSLLRTIQTMIKKKCGFCFPIINGCCGLSDQFGLLPHRRPIITVIGASIRVNRIDNPTSDQVDQLHLRYCNALKGLFEEHKLKYGVPSHVHLTFH